MPFAQVDQAGNICATTSAEVAGEMPDGLIQIEVPDGVDGGSYSIDMTTMQPVLLPPVPDQGS
jgi:hypothetical protein